MSAMTYQESRLLGRNLALKERTIGRKQQKLALARSKGNNQLIQRREQELNDVVAEYNRLRSKYDQETLAQSREDAPRNYNLNRGIAPKRTDQDPDTPGYQAPTARERLRQEAQQQRTSFVTQTQQVRETRALSQGANYQTSTGDFYRFERTSVNGGFASGPGLNYTPFVAASVAGPTDGRPQYTSAYGFSSAEGAAEIFYSDTQTTPTGRPGPRTPTFAQQRREDQLRVSRAIVNMASARTPREFLVAKNRGIRAVGLPLIEQPGLGLERGSQYVQSRLPERYETTPVPFVLRVGEGLGEYARREPDLFARDVTVSVIVGGVAGAGVGYGLSRVAATRGVQAAFRVERAINVAGGSVALGSLGVIGATSGPEGVGRVLPSYAGFGVGYGTGYTSAGGGARVNIQSGRRVGAPVITQRDTLVFARARATGDARVTAFRQEFTSPASIQARFVGRQLSETNAFRGMGMATARVEVPGRVLTSRSFFTGTLAPQSGVFSARAGPETIVSVTGQPVARARETQVFPTSTFTTIGGRVRSQRAGAIIAEQYRIPVRRLRRGIAFREATGGVGLGPTYFLTTEGTERVVFGTSQDAPVSMSIGRGGRGRLARGLELADVGEGVVGPDQSFRDVFTPQNILSASLFAGGTTIGRAGSIGRGVLLPRPPRTVTQPEGVRPVDITGVSFPQVQTPTPFVTGALSAGQTGARAFSQTLSPTTIEGIGEDVLPIQGVTPGERVILDQGTQALSIFGFGGGGGTIPGLPTPQTPPGFPPGFGIPQLPLFAPGGQGRGSRPQRPPRAFQYRESLLGGLGARPARGVRSLPGIEIRPVRNTRRRKRRKR